MDCYDLLWSYAEADHWKDEAHYWEREAMSWRNTACLAWVALIVCAVAGVLP